eukprot:gene7689-10460_t
MSSSESTKDIGGWEKHTKGIGLKLLQKMGFKGRLGAREDGISRAVEVVVRPNQVGLGFGDIVEATSLKINKQIEAEWKGVELVDTEDGVKTKNLAKLSESERLAHSNGWKKGRNNSQRKIQKINLEDIIKINNSESVSTQMILDMRNNDSGVLIDLADINQTIISDSALAKPMLGQEFLHNLNIIHDNLDLEVKKDVRKMERERSIISNNDINLVDITEHLERDFQRFNRLEKLYLVLERIDSKVNDDDNDDITINSIVTLFKTLHTEFKEEFILFGLINCLLQLMRKIAMKLSWKPFSDTDDEKFLPKFYQSWLPLIQYFEDLKLSSIVGQIQQAMHNIVETYFLPIIRRAIINDWVVKDAAKCIEIMEYLQILLPSILFEQTLDMIIMPRLTTAVNEWKPSNKNPTSMIHLWLHPWLPLLHTKISGFFPDIRRRIAQFLSTWHPRDELALLILKPWIAVFDQNSMDNLVVRCIIPKVVFVMRDELHINPSNQDINPFLWVIRFEPLIPFQHFTCILAGEFFPRWLRALYIWLSAENANLSEISQWYSGWKSLFSETLLKDELIMGPFNMALDMMKTVLMNNSISSFHETLLAIERQNYFNIYEKKSIEMKAKIRLSELQSGNGKQNISAKRKHNSQAVSTFKEVVEEFALENNIEFAPRSGRLYEGKQVWLFGNNNCYFDQNVIFVSKSDVIKGHGEDQWQPISLEDLLVISK